MATILLSNNWIPLLLPLVIIGIILVLPDYLYPYLQRQQLQRENKLIEQLTNTTRHIAPVRKIEDELHTDE